MRLLKNSFYALIPARGGSKGIVGKNLHPIIGRPLISYTIEAAKESKYISQIYTSSDSDEILKLSMDSGVNTLRRPHELSSDHASSVDVVYHFLDHLLKINTCPKSYIVFLQPTSPLRSCWHIDNAIELMLEKGADSLVSVCELTKSPYKSFKIGSDGRLESLFDQRMSNFRRQDLDLTYTPNGAIYIFSIQKFLDEGGFPSNGGVPFVMNEMDSLDIDTMDDIFRLERYLNP